jgi:hypothetical protein
MSYVVQNFYFSEKKLTLNFRIKYHFFLSCTNLFQILLKFHLSQRHFMRHLSTLSLLLVLLKLTSLYKPVFFLHRAAVYKPRNYANNLYLSVVFWRLYYFNSFQPPFWIKKGEMKYKKISLYFYLPVTINTSEIHKNFYDKIIYFYFINNHFIWTATDHRFTPISAYFFIISYLKLNVFLNSLFFPVYNF